MEEKILNEMSKMFGEVKQELGKLSEKVDNLEKRIGKLEENQGEMLNRIGKLEENQDKIFDRMDIINENQISFNIIQFQTNEKLDELIKQNRKLEINQTALLKMQIQFLRNQKELKEGLIDGNYGNYFV